MLVPCFRNCLSAFSTWCKFAKLLQITRNYGLGDGEALVLNFVLLEAFSYELFAMFSSFFSSPLHHNFSPM
jgi:hypothetical protein